MSNAPISAGLSLPSNAPILTLEVNELTGPRNFPNKDCETWGIPAGIALISDRAG